MFILIFVSSIAYSAIIIYSFNLIPYKWLCDYDADISDCPAQKLLSFPLHFFLIFLFTLFNLLLIFSQPHSILNIFTSVMMTGILAHICLSDILYLIIPDQHILLIFILGFLNVNLENAGYKLTGIFAGALPLLLLLALGLLLKDREYIGFGDIKLMGALGFLTGCTNILNVYIISSFLSGIFFLIIAFLTVIKMVRTTPAFMPLAPFISLAFTACTQSL